MGTYSRVSNKLSRAIPVQSWYRNQRHRFATSSETHPQVLWLSHHIPKTAGRSLEAAYKESFGKGSVLSVYNDTTAPERLSSGKPIWTPKSTIIIHGHFRPHVKHLDQFPNARRMIWLRDPLQRAASLLRFMESRTMDRPVFERFKSMHRSDDMPFFKRLEALLKTVDLQEQTRVYQTWLSKFSPADFAFIGRQEEYEKDLRRLELLMGKQLPFLRRNLSLQSDEPLDTRHLASLLSDEYAIYREWLSTRYSEK